MVFQGAGYTGTLSVSNAVGAVTYTTTTFVTGLTVDASGDISGDASLAPGTHTVSGTDTDNANPTPNSGTWSFKLKVGGKLNQTAMSMTGNVPFGTALADKIVFTATTPALGTVDVVATGGANIADFSVQTNGDISTPPNLSPGTYTVTGTATDSNDNFGTWTYTLTVGGILTQTSPTTAYMPFTMNGTNESGYAGQLTVSGAGANTVTYLLTSQAVAGLTVTGGGAITGAVTLAPGASYTISGTDSDNGTPQDEGTWTFTLFVGGKIVESDPMSVVVPNGQGYVGQVAVTSSVGNLGTVAFTQTSGTPNIVVSPTGEIAVPDTAGPNTYNATGDDTDSNGETGTWAFEVTVELEQLAPTQASVPAGSSYSGQLNVAGATGAVTYSATAGDTLDVSVSKTGAIFAPPSLASGTYSVSGFEEDASGNSGIWTFTLVVGANLIQGNPIAANIALGNTYNGQLTTTNNVGAVIYNTTSPDVSGLTISKAGVIVGKDTLTNGIYALSGFDTDAVNNAGTWSFSLTVGSGGTQLVQSSSTTATVASGAGYNGQLAVTGNTGTVAYSQNSAPVTGLNVTSAGVITGATNLAVGNYTISGVDSDALNDGGTWTFTLTVGSGLQQGTPTSATVALGSIYTGQLNVTGNSGTVTYTEVTTSNANLAVSDSGAITGSATLPLGTYTVSGTDVDSVNNSGSWTFSLTVSSSVLTQTSATSASTPTGTAYSGQLEVSGATGTVTYSEAPSGDSPDVTVSSAGVISDSAGLAAGTYTVSGNDADTANDVGTWIFTLTVGTKTLEQGSPSSATVLDNAGYSGQLTVTNASGTVTYSETASANTGQVIINTSGAISSATNLSPGTYTVGGTMADTSGDSGTWTFSLTVSSFISPPASNGAYDLVGSDGGVFAFGSGGGFYGSLPGMHIHVNNIVGIVPTADDLGYFLVGSDGGVFSFGDAPFENSLPGLKVVVNDIVGIVPTTDDKGYYLVGRDGGVFAFGDAPFLNSLPGEGVHVNNIVGIATTPGDGGYWLVSSTGMVYDLGNAAALGNAASGPIVSITATPSGAGYWLTSNNGTVSNFGNAVSSGSLPAKGVSVSNIVSLVPSPDGGGYLLIGRDGGIFAFGDATFPGSLPGDHVTVNNIVGAVPT